MDPSSSSPFDPIFDESELPYSPLGGRSGRLLRHVPASGNPDFCGQKVLM